MVTVVTVGFALIVALVIGAVGNRRGWTTGQMIVIAAVIVVPVDMLVGYNWSSFFLNN